MKCPSCGHTWSTTKAKHVVQSVDPTQMTDAELFAYYKRTAPVEDLKFYARHCGRADWAQRFTELAETNPTSKDAWALIGRYKHETSDYFDMARRRLWKREMNRLEMPRRLTRIVEAHGANVKANINELRYKGRYDSDDRATLRIDELKDSARRLFHRAGRTLRILDRLERTENQERVA